MQQAGVAHAPRAVSSPALLQTGFVYIKKIRFVFPDNQILFAYLQHGLHLATDLKLLLQLLLLPAGLRPPLLPRPPLTPVRSYN